MILLMLKFCIENNYILYNIILYYIILYYIILYYIILYYIILLYWPDKAVPLFFLKIWKSAVTHYHLFSCVLFASALNQNLVQHIHVFTKKKE